MVSPPVPARRLASQVNKNYLSAMHVDKGNVGRSYIVGVGDFSGGDLWVHRQKYQLKSCAQSYTPTELAGLLRPSSNGYVRGWDFPWEERIAGESEALQVKDKWHAFDGNMPHCTLPYQGTRYTLIYFTQRSHHQIDKKSREFLTRKIGFPFPPMSLQKPPYPKQLMRLDSGVEAFNAWRKAAPENEAKVR